MTERRCNFISLIAWGNETKKIHYRKQKGGVSLPLPRPISTHRNPTHALLLTAVCLLPLQEGKWVEKLHQSSVSPPTHPLPSYLKRLNARKWKQQPASRLQTPRGWQQRSSIQTTLSWPTKMRVIVPKITHAVSNSFDTSCSSNLPQQEGLWHGRDITSSFPTSKN